MNLEEHLGKLAAQGSADQIADFFEQQGIVGRPEAGSQCPVARWLNQQSAHWYSVGQHGTAQYVTKTVELGRYEVSMVEHCENPESVTDFVKRFDKGHYPQLVGH